jgi:DNA-binding FrmR family transcriptional regulator
MHQHSENKVKEKSIHRLKIIQGHLKAIEQMIQDDEYCVDIIHQSIAVQRALKKLDMQIMQNHLETCVVDQIKNNEEQKSITELMRLFEMK